MSKFKTALPELLAPAGDMERFQRALYFGADAIYVGGSAFSMRAAPANFSFEELKKATSDAHSKGVKVYLTCNTVPKNDEIEKLPDFLMQARDCDVDAFIISDMGVMSLAKKYTPDVDIHISTQAGITNYASAAQWYELGATRVVTARELSINDIAEMREKTPKELEIECFVHGAMCVSFSGRCLLSNYLVGRDSNRGDCAQPCRWQYSLMEKTREGEYFPIDEDENGTYIMNSKDMCMIEHIPDMVKAGITSFKIEGRAKSAYYTSVITNAYRKAIDGYLANPSDDYVPEKWVLDEMNKVSSREYCTGFYYGHPRDNAQIFYDGGYKRDWSVMAEVIDYKDGRVICRQRNRIFEGDTLEVLARGEKPYDITIRDLRDENGESIEKAPHPMMIFSFECDKKIPAEALLRKAL
ncbi:MAG: U32 family peptidase [Clostridia bacterium]|nr:U32 family peptidase [Clostridia bacterium]